MSVDDDNERLNGTLADAVDMLRRPVGEVREEWRKAVLDRIADDARGPHGLWTIRIRPAFAVAAVLALLITGAGTGVLVQLMVGPRPTDIVSAPVAQAPATVRFVYVGSDAREVALVGDFNGWDPRAVQLRRLADGQTWIAEVPLAAGRYAYAFMVDGKLIADPTAARTPDDDFGAASSVLMVRGS